MRNEVPRPSACRSADLQDNGMPPGWQSRSFVKNEALGAACDKSVLQVVAGKLTSTYVDFECINEFERI